MSAAAAGTDTPQPAAGPLRASIVEGAVIDPVVTRDDHPGVLLMGVFDSAGDLVAGTPTNRRSGLRGVATPAGIWTDPPEDGGPEAIYAGDLHHHFGHFLLESAARLWYAGQHPEVPIVWTADYRWHDGGLLPWQREILDILGVTNPVRYITRPTGFGRLHVPDIGYRYDDWFHPDHADFLASWQASPPEPGRRLWLSRSNIGTEVRTLTAEIAEGHLARAGWTIIHPEELTVREQLTQLARAEVIAGEEGSAFHLLMLMDDVSGRSLDVIRRQGAEHRNFHTIAAARDIEQRFHTLDGERVLRAEGRAVTKISRSSGPLLDALDVPVAIGGNPSVHDRAAATVMRALPGASLLEVQGRTAFVAATAATGDAVVVSTRLVVDPRLPRELSGSIVEVPLDDYVDSYRPEGQTFDVIRVGGAHTTAIHRAMVTSESLAHRRTMWLLDGDLAGTDVARNLHAAAKHRVWRVGSQHGSVYVAVRSAPDAPLTRPARVLSLATSLARRAILIPELRPADLAALLA